MLTEHEVLRAILCLLGLIFLTEVLLDGLFRWFLEVAHRKLNPEGKEYRRLLLFSVSMIAASFGATQLELLGTGLTYSLTYYVGAVLLTLAFIMQKNLPGLKLEFVLVVSGVLFGYVFTDTLPVNDLSLGNLLTYLIVFVATIAAFQVVYMLATLSGIDVKLQRWSLRIPDWLASTLGTVGTCSIATAFILNQVQHPAFHLDLGLTFTLLNTLGSMGWAVILMRINKVDNLSLEAVFIGFGMIGLYQLFF